MRQDVLTKQAQITFLALEVTPAADADP